MTALQHERTITESLRRTKASLEENVRKAELTRARLRESTSQLAGVRDDTKTYANLLHQSKGLVVAQERRDRTNKLLQLFGLLFVLAVCAYIVAKRLFKLRI